MIHNYIAPIVGDLQLASLRAEHLDRLYTDLVGCGAANGGPLAAKTVYDVHVVIRSALRHATRCRLVDHNVALDAHPPRPTTRSRPSPERRCPLPPGTMAHLLPRVQGARHRRTVPRYPTSDQRPSVLKPAGGWHER